METDPADSTIQKINSHGEYHEAMATLFTLATRNIAIFDYNLEDSEIDAPEHAATFRKFLLKNRSNTLSIVLQDPTFLIRYCPRLQTLLRQFSHAVFIQQSGPEAKNVYDPFIIVDSHMYLRRFHHDSPRGVWCTEGQAVNENLRKRFQEIWETSAPALTATTLGL